MNHAVIADASPVALKDGAGTATGIDDTSVFTTMMQAVTEDDLKDAGKTKDQYNILFKLISKD